MTQVAISLTKELNEFVEKSVNAGLFHNASELVANALHTMQAQNMAKLEALRAEIAIGTAQADRGEFIEFDAESVIAEGRDRLAADGRAD